MHTWDTAYHSLSQRYNIILVLLAGSARVACRRMSFSYTSPCTAAAHSAEPFSAGKLVRAPGLPSVCTWVLPYKHIHRSDLLDQC